MDARAMSAWPYVSILVAAKNERAVIERLVTSLTQLDYPPQRFDLWMIDDHSTDGTAELLDQLAASHRNVHVVHRGAQATGGKSGALNEVWPKTQGSVLVVFDADAQVPPDLLRRVVPWFEQPGSVLYRCVRRSPTRI
jgi:1,2-diacylglycerol 3-beta-glucosyltransferase